MPVYYNEIDKLKAEVLRQAIKANAIAPGDVDERSICDVRPSELLGYTQCHFFAGGGFWSLALRQAGWPDDRPVWTGSCPCPSFSAAGKGGGFDDPRHLWPDWFKLIDECKPPVVFGEQADDAVGYGWFDLVQTDLEAQTYAVGKAILGACSVGAPHIRQRLYFVGDLEDSRYAEVRRPAGSSEAAGGRTRRTSSGPGHAERMGHSSGKGFQECIASGRIYETSVIPYARTAAQRRSNSSLMGNPSRERCGEARTGSGRPEEWDGDASEPGVVGNADSQPSERNARSISSPQAALNSEGFHDGSLRHGYSDAGPVNGFWRDAEWIPCRVPEVPGAVEWRAIERGTFALAARYSERVAELRLAGDAINVEVAKEFIEAYCEARSGRV